ncbi:MAG: hypothetical protein WA908_07940 [Pontixanthobacter sp.]
MTPLILHPDCANGPIDTISAAIKPTSNGCSADFYVNGDLGEIVIPEQKAPARQDDLWKTTCFEIFWQPHGDSAYREFNLSPSQQWACYDFDDVRRNGRDGAVEEIGIECNTADGALHLRANIRADLSVPADVALNAVIETTDGMLQFWALKFDECAPEFHSPTCRAKHLAGRL